MILLQYWTELDFFFFFLQILPNMKKEPFFPPLKKCAQNIVYSVLYVSVSLN